MNSTLDSNLCIADRPLNHSALTQTLMMVDSDLQHSWEIPDSGPLLRAIVAYDRRTRERAYRLAHRIYAKCGYVSGQREAMCVARYDAEPFTLTLLLEDSLGNELGTVSLAFDSDARLPCDEIYHEELNALRGQGRKLVEVTRLVMDTANVQSKKGLTRIFNFVYLYAWRVRHYTDLVIEVNPHHVDYYRRLLMFEPIGPERVCPRVQGAPAVLMRVPLATLESETARQHTDATGSSRRRNLCGSFLHGSDQDAAVDFLSRCHVPMLKEDAAYFGI